MGVTTDDNFRWRGLRILLAVSTIPIVIITILRIHRCWPNGAYLGNPSGVWIALANDLCHGVFYRPLYSPLGYGGTRYFPLQFVVQAGLIKLGGNPIMTGHLLSLCATLALMAGIYFLLRRLGVDNLLSFCSSVFVLCSESTQLALHSIRGDVLPAALVVWGIVACCGTTVGLRQLVIAAILFTLAFSAKITAGYAVCAVFLFFLLSGRRRQAWTLAALSATGFTVVIAGMLIASDGRAFDVLKACLFGGENLTSIRQTPQRLALFAFGEDVGGSPFLLLASAALLTWPRRFWKEIAPLFFLCAAGMTVIVYGSPGTDYNHLIDLQAAAIILLAVWISRSDRTTASFGLAALAIAALLAVFPAGRSFHMDDTFQGRREMLAAVQIAKSDSGPILSKNPLIPLLAGQTPYIIDPFMFAMLSRSNPHFNGPLCKMLQERKFSEVVLPENPASNAVGKRSRKPQFSDGFSQKLLENYTLARKMKEEYIFLPRQH